jgi:hypothetical protein
VSITALFKVCHFNVFKGLQGKGQAGKQDPRAGAGCGKRLLVISHLISYFPFFWARKLGRCEEQAVES